MRIPFLITFLALAPLLPAASAAGEEAEPQAPDLSLPADPASPRNLPDTMAPLSGGDDEMTPGALSPRAQFEAAMITIDSGLARLTPAVPIAATDLKRLAFTRLAADPRMAAQQRRLLETRLHELAVADGRLRSIDRVLERWRTSAHSTTGALSATMISGVRRRAATASGLHRQIDCGRYFGRATARAMRAGHQTTRPPIPPGC